MSVKVKDWVYGIHPVMELLRSGKEIEKVFIQKDLSSDGLEEIKQLLRDRSVQYQLVPLAKLNRMVPRNHQGIIGLQAPVNYWEVESLLPQIYEKGEDPLFLILDRVTDVRNFGAMLRTAECLGVHGVIFPSKESALINSDAVKSSAGAIFHIPLCKVSSMEKVVRYLQSSGLKIFACTEQGSDFIESADLKGPCALILGSEEDGISNYLLKNADQLLRINMKGKTSSLNVGAAAAISLYEITRQRNIG
ncbi:MAG: 23S rRNA (guanosine(2251)-2'-O)-methyltransferase RlmB [Bacteroidia bacterium]|nr:23S rRNA (guanosine(2251)-2'-O)-methyltransferase RlmB [Bacteroidia bacterium]